MSVLQAKIGTMPLHRLLFVAGALSASVLANAAAQAQIAYGNADPSVIVDLSVLDDGGFGMAAPSAAPRPGVSMAPGSMAPGQPRLLMPGSQAPTSTLHVTPPAAERRSVARAPAAERPAAAPRPTAPTAAAPTAIMPPAAPARPSAPVVAAVPSTPSPAAPVTPPAATATLSAPPPPPALAPAPTPRQTSIARVEPPPPPPAPAAPAAVAPPPPPPVTPPVAAPRAEERPAEQAARPAVAPDAVKGPAPAMSVPFGTDASRVPPAAQEQLKTLAGQIKDKADSRIQLVAYASGDELTSSRARRLSLSRALAVRSLLIDLGVRSTRIDVRALGDKAADDPQNRVDVIVTER